MKDLGFWEQLYLYRQIALGSHHSATQIQVQEPHLLFITWDFSVVGLWLLHKGCVYVCVCVCINFLQISGKKTAQEKKHKMESLSQLFMLILLISNLG